MAIYRLIANGSFGPAEVKAMTAAYEAAGVDPIKPDTRRVAIG